MPLPTLPKSTATTPNNLSHRGMDLHRQETSASKSRRWRVIHACEHARDILPVVEGQVIVGMRPYLVTPQGAGTAELYLAREDLAQGRPLSLIRAWQDVRQWRKCLLECNPEDTSDLVHTHSFASGMAGVRNLACVVYDFKACIEEFAISAGLCEHGSWMGRSFRVAEQFILTRAQAVVVHSLGMKSAAAERGSPPENIFLIPDPQPAGEDCPLFDGNLLLDRFGVTPETIGYFVPHSDGFGNTELPRSIVSVLEAFVMAATLIPRFRLLIEAPSTSFEAIGRRAHELGIGEQVIAVNPDDALAAMRNSTIVIVTGDLPEDPVQARQPNTWCMRSLAMGKPVVAANVLRNRDASAEGRGCLWFEENDVNELIQRIAFLGNHQEFRQSLGASARAYFTETRNSSTVGQQYDAAYRHAISRRKLGGPGQPANSLLPLNCAV